MMNFSWGSKTAVGTSGPCSCSSIRRSRLSSTFGDDQHTVSRTDELELFFQSHSRYAEFKIGHVSAAFGLDELELVGEEESHGTNAKMSTSAICGRTSGSGRLRAPNV